MSLNELSPDAILELAATQIEQGDTWSNSKSPNAESCVRMCTDLARALIALAEGKARLTLFTTEKTTT